MFIGGTLSKSLPAAATSAGLVSMVLLLACGPYFIRWLKSRYTERIASDSAKLNELHAAKQNTPTMGGLLISAAIVLTILCFSDLTQPLVWLICGTVVSLALLGAYDDLIKLRTRQKGLTARKKLMVQVVISSVFAACVYLLQQQQGHMPSVLIPWSGLTIQPGIYWIPWAVFVIVGASNAVNLTDGLDGLATGTTAIGSLALIIVICGGRLANVDDNTRTTAAVSCATLVGSSLGFLWWNRHPALIFMGDAGSLPIGGLLAVTSLLTGTELILAIVGAVFVVETFSVILQVAWFRRTRRRILLCSPLHNHFVFRGVAEAGIVGGFWLAAVFAALLGVSAAFW